MTSRGAAAERHVPVLRDRVVELLAPALSEAGAVYVDGTLGMGGHAEAVLERFPEVRVVGIDRDEEALALAGERLAAYADRLQLVHAVSDELAEVLDDLRLPAYDAGLFDLGVSSLQLDEADRGFAYAKDAPLDMRMDQGEGPTAADVLNTYAARDLERVLRDYGEERFARRIATTIVAEREREPFTTSARLVELLRRVVPAASQRTGGNPAKRTFQALRIEVNDELGTWRRAVAAAIGRLRVGGRLAVLAYHSLEDRITKQAFAAGATSTTPPGLPVDLPEHAAYLRLLTRGAERASDAEIAANPRSASVRLRAAERIRPTKGTSR
ncbi:S-adenosyl-dependent methyltransferase active on membrane-located substrates [Nostocoides japonicum T1-X7]|uniref:Ribosomal RNA small subunit methyltransferase H n=1 Tax=Nostocoides japonicum T1-X7 TaxID=1194083 RepID=A0A077LZD1_9MICO|nr:16S rRNA (cytosine(1402)-N(4))-methyltransferase RsmH [Tetrasphaera japonica]CCH77319.1 S-adenosyl-dependent methyltransferase active on membrane-located substrates [Tetrasphaera japonica T1-X7]